jgi:hypothetical protein
VKTQPAPKVSRTDVTRIVRRDFPHLPEAEVLAILDRYGRADWQRDRDRVQLAILKLADGDFEALRQHTDVACTDYRDVLTAAEYPAYSRRPSTAPSASTDQAETFEGDWKQYRLWLKKE